MTNWTKRDIINQAFSELGKDADDISPESYQSALRQLDAMMAQWALQGIRIGYIGGDGKGDIDLDVNVPLWAVEGLYFNLAVRMAPGFGKTPSAQTLMGAKEGKDTLMANSSASTERKIVGYAGAGGYYPNLPTENDPLGVGGDGTLTFGE